MQLGWLLIAATVRHDITTGFAANDAIFLNVDLNFIFFFFSELCRQSQVLRKGQDNENVPGVFSLVLQHVPLLNKRAKIKLSLKFCIVKYSIYLNETCKSNCTNVIWKPLKALFSADTV